MQNILKLFLVLSFLSFLMFLYLENLIEDKIIHSMNKTIELNQEVKIDSLVREKTRKRVISFNDFQVTKHNDEIVTHLYNQLDSLRLLIILKENKVKKNNLLFDSLHKKQAIYEYYKYASFIIFILSIMCMFLILRKIGVNK